MDRRTAWILVLLGTPLLVSMLSAALTFIYIVRGPLS